MNRLPTEILNQIFILLHQRQKVELMCVCRHWAYVIEKYTLFDTIIIHSRDRFRDLIQKLLQTQKKELPSILTRCLILETDLGTDFDLLPAYFPNVRVIYLGKKIRVDAKKWLRFDRIVHMYESCRKSNGGDSTRMTIGSDFESTISSSSSFGFSSSSEGEEDEELEQLEEEDEFISINNDINDDTDQSRSSRRRHRFRRRYTRIRSKNVTSQLLSSNPCPHLRTLSVSIYPISGKEFIRLLIHAPNLTQLTLNEFTITFERLELLHSTLPCLERFSVLEGGVAPVDKILPDKIQPAHRITHVFFKIHRGRILMKTRFLQYMKLKYTNLYEFSFYNVFTSENHLALSSPIATHLRAQQQQGQQQEQRSNNTPHFFVDGLIPLLSGFGSQLKRLTVRVPLLDADELMKGLKNANYQLDHLGIETSHVTYILQKCVPALKSFAYLHSLCLQDPDGDDFEYLKELKHLRKLQIYRPSPEEFHIHELLDMCSDQLESLTLADCWLISDLYSANACPYALKELRLTKVMIGPEVDTFLALFLPNLTTIAFNDCHFENTDFCLPGHHILQLTVTDHSFCTKTNDYILVRTLNVHQEKVYAVSQPYRRQLFFDQGPAFKANRHQSSPCFLAFGPRVTFTFASVKGVLVSTTGSRYSRPMTSSSIFFL